jgi:tetratricopeptide (TPR) repeat protein
MISENEHNAGLQSSFTRSILPWIILAGALALYLVTLNRWVTIGSLGNVAKLAGWDWQPTLTSPLLFVITYPLRWLPVHLQPIGLNLMSAVGAALTLALLARSVALLPHDRTKEQRMREQSDFALLNIPGAWVPPLIAVLACALQLNFWEHATTGTGEMLNLLLFAYIIRCLLEYRIRERDSWLVRMSFVYGLAVTNNWAMIGFFPLTLAGVIWLKREEFFNARFFFKMLAAGLAGLLLYLLLPLLALQYHHEALTFFTALKVNLGQQKQFLLYRDFRWPFAILAFTASMLPLLLVVIRWPSGIGDVNPLGNVFSQFMFRVLHLGFFGVGLVIMYGPAFVVAQFEDTPLPFLTHYYLAALCAGYFAGYLLLVFGVPTARSWARPNIFEQAFGKVILAIVWACVLVVPAFFATKNLPIIQANNGPALHQFATRLAQSLPPKSAVVLSDEPVRLWLLAAYYAEQKATPPHPFVNTAALSYRLYHEYLLRQYPNLWQPLPMGPGGKAVTEPVSAYYLIDRIRELSQTQPIYYLHPSFGYYFEFFYSCPRGLAFELRHYSAGQTTIPPISPEDLKSNLEFWEKLTPDLNALAAWLPLKTTDVIFLARAYSRSLNQWGVQLQLNQLLPAAAAMFSRAIQLNRDNVVAQINLAFNQQMQTQKGDATTAKEVENKLRLYRTWDTILTAHGPFDEPLYNFYLGQLLTRTGLHRQAAQLFLRARQLMTNSIEADLMLGEVYLQAGGADQAFALLREIQQSPNPRWQDYSNKLELVRLEALAYFAKSNQPAAEAVLQAAIQKAPKDPLPLAIAANVYLTRNQPSNALMMIEKQLQLKPDNLMALLNKSVVLMQLQQHGQAIVPLTQLLQKEPNNNPARMSRAIAYLQLGLLEEARKDYEHLRQAFPNLFAVHYGLGEIAYRKQDKRAAIAHYEAYLKHAPKGTQERKDVEARLRQLKGS